MVNAGGHLRLWLLHRDVLIAAATHSAGVAAIVFLGGGVVPRILECTFVDRSFYLGFPLRLLVVLHLLLENAVTHRLADSLHSLELLPCNTLLLDTQSFSTGAT